MPTLQLYDPYRRQGRAGWLSVTENRNA